MSAFASGSSVLGGSRCGDCLPIRAPHLSRVAYSTLKSFPEAPALVLCILQSPAALSPRSDSKEMLVRGSTHTTHPRSCQRANHARLSDGGAGVRRGVRCKAFRRVAESQAKRGLKRECPLFFFFLEPKRLFFRSSAFGSLQSDSLGKSYMLSLEGERGGGESDGTHIHVPS